MGSSGSELTKTSGGGGAETVGGIWYQGLYIVLQAVERLLAFQDISGPVQFVAEPRNGGDVRVTNRTRHRVTQIKKKAGGGSWSLGDVIDEVLPDLFKATADATYDPTKAWTYEFVTEGRLGRWKEALTFFHNLSGLEAEQVQTGGSWIDAYETLDDVQALNLGNKNLASPYQNTRRGLFDHIVDCLRGPAPEKGKPDERIDVEVGRERTWCLLRGFQFIGGRSEEHCRAELRRHLLHIVPNHSAVDDLLDQMLGWITDASRQGHKVFTPEEMLAGCGLEGVVPVGDLIALRERTQRSAQDAVQALGYIAGQDTRRTVWGDDALVSSSTTPVVVTGDSGDGKSWALYAAADQATTSAVVFIDASNSGKLDAEQLVNRAAERVWQVGLSHDNQKTMAALTERLAQTLGKSMGRPWLTLCIDQVDDPVLARSLVQQPWSTWGVRLIIGVSNTARSAAEQAGKADSVSAKHHAVRPFSLPELQKYLEARLGPASWKRVPHDVHDVLRKPQLAKLYVDLKLSGEAGEEWQPTDEYALVDAFWHRLASTENGGHHRDELRLRRLAIGVAEGKPYPWSIDQVDEADLSDEVLNRLIQAGWLRQVDEIYDMPHDRLLGYAVARAIIGRCRSENLDPNAIADLLDGTEDRPRRTRLGYLLMDWFHLALGSGEQQSRAPAVLQRVVEKNNGSAGTSIQEVLLPTLGQKVIPLLVSESKRLAVSAPAWELQASLRGLAKVLADALEADRERVVHDFLDDGAHQIRLAGLHLMSMVAAPGLLDRAWELHREILDHPDRYTARNTRVDQWQHVLRRASFDALAFNLPARPSWICDAVEQVESSDHPDQLAWLIAQLEDDGATWQACKHRLFDVVAQPDGNRSLARNIGLWQDHDELKRLEGLTQQLLGSKKLGAADCVAAMIRLDPERAVELLTEIDAMQLYMSRLWLLPPLMAATPHKTQEILHDRITSLPSPLDALRWFQGNADFMSEAILQTLLDNLDVGLADWPSWTEEEKTKEKTAHWLATEFEVLASISDPKLIEVFARYREQRLENNLFELLRTIGPQDGGQIDSPTRYPLTRVLLKIGPKRTNEAARLFLKSTDYIARSQGIALADRIADDATREDLLQVTLGPGTGDENGDALNRQDAIQSLARHGDFERLLRVGQDRADLLVIAAIKTAQQSGCDEATAQQLKKQAKSSEPEVAARAIALLRLGGVDDAVDAALDLLRQNATPITRHSAFTYLQSYPIRNVEDAKLIAGLEQGKHEDGAINSLLRADPAVAAGALCDILREKWEPQFAAILLSRQLAAKDVHDLALLELEKSVTDDSPFPLFDGGDFLSHLYSKDPAVARRMLREVGPDAHHALLRTALAGRCGIHTTGSQRIAIRGLAAFDRSTAADCAERALLDPEYPDRSLMPSVLHELDPERARAVFLKLAATLDVDDTNSFGHKKPREVARAMELALSESDSEWLLASLRSNDYEARLGAAKLCIGSAAVSEGCATELRKLANARSSSLSKAASRTLTRLERILRARRVLSALPEDASDEQAAAAVDAAVGVLTERQAEEVGNQNEPPPPWILELIRHPAVQNRPALFHWAADGLNESRKMP